MKERLNILDWYCHQGNQYEFFKTGHNFYLVGVDGKVPDWNKNHRPLGSNVKLISEEEAKDLRFDIVIARSGIKNHKRYSRFTERGSILVGTIQTTVVPQIPKECRHIIWNSNDVMKRFSRDFPSKSHYYIVHGFDPDEFSKINLPKNGKILTMVNHFKSRGEYTGYDLWVEVTSKLSNCDLIGPGNEDIDKRIKGLDSFSDLIKAYNSYSIFFNPTSSSAMPRSRGEAAMCGMPIVSTDNFDVKNYFQNNKSAILSNNVVELVASLRLLRKNESLRAELGEAAREVAIKNFHIKDYIRKINSVFIGL